MPKLSPLFTVLFSAASLILIGSASAGPVTPVQTPDSADVLVEAPLSADAWLMMSHEIVERENPVVDQVPEVTLKTPVAIAPLPPAVLTGAGMLIGTALVKMIRKIRIS